jgi:hypothetical protein
VSSVPRRPASGNTLLAATYVRVSLKQQVEGYSLDAQRRACSDFCAARGLTVVANYADEGVSAHTDNLAKRPDFPRLLADAESGRFNVIVVHKMDRFARKLRVALECLEQLGRFLHHVRLPDDAQACILEAYREARPEVSERDRQRQAIEGQLRRLGDLFVPGDLAKNEYESRRAELRNQLTNLSEEDGHGRPEILERLQRHLLNAGAAWDDADASQRNRLIRALFEGVQVRERHLVSVRPRPEFQPYLTLLDAETPSPVAKERRCLNDERGGGLEGIRTPGLGLDRAAC